jgi:hypothetical protein
VLKQRACSGRLARHERVLRGLLTPPVSPADQAKSADGDQQEGGGFGNGSPTSLLLQFRICGVSWLRQGLNAST